MLEILWFPRWQRHNRKHMRTEITGTHAILCKHSGKNLRGIISPLFCDMNNTCRKEIQISKKHDPQNQSSTLQHPTPTNQTTTSLATDGVLCVSLVAKVLFLFTASCEIVCSNPAESPLSTSHSPTATADGRSKQAWDETNPNRRTT